MLPATFMALSPSGNTIPALTVIVRALAMALTAVVGRLFGVIA
jgi:hypothetical protein